MWLPTSVSAWEWEKAREQALQWAHVCAICGNSLHPDATPRSRWSSSVDHKIPRSVFRHFDLETQRFLCLDPSNLQVVHVKCNSRKRDRRQRQIAPRIRSQIW